METKKFKLQTYSVFAVCYLLMHERTNAEAVYTDIPDTLLDFDSENFYIDLNNDGVNDFELRKRSFSFSVTTYYSGYATSHLTALSADPEAFGNKIAGFTEQWGGGSSGYFTMFFPYALLPGQVINETLSFHDADFEVLAFRYRGQYSSYAAHGGDWYPEVLGHYLGVFLKGEEGCFHYGWIRCDVKNEGKELVIMDFAYESKCETGIYAGDTIGDTSTVEVSELSTFVPILYSYAGVLNISLNKQLMGAKYTVFNLEGKIIHTGYLNELNNKLNINCNDGIYLVIIKKDEYSYSKQILLTK